MSEQNTSLAGERTQYPLAKGEKFTNKWPLSNGPKGAERKPELRAGTQRTAEHQAIEVVGNDGKSEAHNLYE